MVPVTWLESALSPLLRALRTRCEAEPPRSPEAGMIGHLTRPHQGELGWTLALPDVDDLRIRMRDPAVMACLGYGLAAAAQGVGVDGWPAARRRLAAREVFSRDRDTFFYYPWQLYGIALGVQAHAGIDPEGIAWLRGVVEEGASRTREGTLVHRLAIELAACACGADVAPAVQLDARRSPLADVAAALWVRKRVSASRIGLHSDDPPEAVLLDRAIQEGVPSADGVSAAFVLVILHETLRDLRRRVGEVLAAGAPSPGAASVVHQTINIQSTNAQLNQNSPGQQRN